MAFTGYLRGRCDMRGLHLCLGCWNDGVYGNVW